MSAVLSVPARPALGAPVAMATTAAVAIAAGVVVAPMPAVALTIGLLVAAAVFARPVIGAYLVLALTPLVTGIDRDRLIPVLRPNEAVLILVVGALVLRGVAGSAAGRQLRARVTFLDVTVVAMAVASSVFPILWLVARREPVRIDDGLYALTLWKYLAVYAIVRATVSTRAEVRRCVEVMVSANVIVGIVAILQSLQLFGITNLLASFYAPFGEVEDLEIGRGTSLLTSSHATGDVMAVSLAICAAALVVEPRRRRPLLGLSGLFLVATVASGQFSAVIGLVMCLLVVGALTKRLTRGAVATAPAALGALVVMQPVVEKRLAGFSTSAGLPQSWLARLENLRRFFWPELFRDFNWVLGVRPSARVKAPEPWREWVWIESGHTWLLWNGGVPLLLAYVAFVLTALKRTAGRAREALGAGDAVVAVVAIAACAAVVQMTVLTLFDPHLTLRGAADLLFALLALTFCRGAAKHGRTTDSEAVGRATADTRTADRGPTRTPPLHPVASR